MGRSSLEWHSGRKEDHRRQVRQRLHKRLRTRSRKMFGDFQRDSQIVPIRQLKGLRQIVGEKTVPGNQKHIRRDIGTVHAQIISDSRLGKHAQPGSESTPDVHDFFRPDQMEHDRHDLTSRLQRPRALPHVKTAIVVRFGCCLHDNTPRRARTNLPPADGRDSPG